MFNSKLGVKFKKLPVTVNKPGGTTTNEKRTSLKTMPLVVSGCSSWRGGESFPSFR